MSTHATAFYMSTGISVRIRVSMDAKPNASRSDTRNKMFFGTTQPAPAVLSHEDIESQIAHYERDFGMSSEELMRRMREGTAPDTFETMDWMILLRNR